MIIQNMQIQAIPLWVILVLYLINLYRKRSFFCISSLVLLYSSLTLLGAVFLHLAPRSGIESYANLDAMLLFSFCYSILHLPMLFIKDGEKQTDKEWLFTEKQFVSISTLLIIIGIPSSIFFLVQGIPNIIDFAFAMTSREEFREGVNSKINGNYTIIALWILCSFFPCSVFMCVYGFYKFPCHRLRNLLLLFCGLAWGFDALRSISRSNIMYTIIFFMVCVIILKKKDCFSKIFGILILCMFPIILISFLRFNDNEGLLYNFYSYFSTGTYSFNSLYAARTDYNFPGAYGFLTCSIPVLLLDTVCNTGYYSRGKQLVAEYTSSISDIGWIYKEIDGSYPGEFKSIVGSFLIDFPPCGVVIFSVLISLLVIVIFSIKSFRINTPAMQFFASVYAYTLISGAFGYIFVTCLYNMFLLSSIIFFIFLFCQSYTFSAPSKN